MAPLPYLVLDIETGAATEEEIQAALNGWKCPTNVKDPEKREAKRKEAEAKIRGQSALLDVAPILVVGCAHHSGVVLFNGMDGIAYTIEGATILPCGDERLMLLAFQQWADAFTGPETVLVGFNHLAFDLPRLRLAYVRHRLPLPECLRPCEQNQAVYDVMRNFTRYFTAENHGELFISLDTVLSRLGLPQYKSLVNGAMIPELAREGRVLEVLQYCAVDTLATREAWQLMAAGL